jgi:hypothetical protein
MDYFVELSQEEKARGRSDFEELKKSMIRQKAMMSHSIAVRGLAVAVGVSSWSGLFA